MHVPDSLKKPIASFDWGPVSQYLEAIGPDELSMEMSDLLDAIFRDGYLIVRRPGGNDRARRDAFLASFRQNAESKGLGQVFKEKADEISAIQSTEEAYLEILSTLQTAISSKLPPPQFAWVAVRLAEREYRKLVDDVRRQVPHLSALIDPPSARFDMESAGGPVDPDQAIELLVGTLTATLKMLAFQQKWFDANGTIILPAAVATHEDHFRLASGNVLLASVWHELERSDGQRRYFGGTVTKGMASLQDEVGGQCERPAVRFNLSGPYELDIAVARERLARRLFQSMADLDHDPLAQKKVITTLPVPPAPAGYVNIEEVHGAFGLSHVFFKSVVDVKREYAGLTILEWLRGYASLQKIARQHRDGDPPSEGLVLLDQPWLETRLVDHGLPQSKVKIFIDYTCLGRDRDDVFDAPLVRCADGKLCLVVAAAASSNLANVVMSQLTSVQADLKWKGPTLEEDILALFRRFGIPAARIKREVDGRELECDCVALWDSVLFVLECKNYSLPGAKAQSAYWFLQDQIDAAVQASTKARILQRHPEVVHEALGMNGQWTQVVPVVLNGIPFSLPGPISEVYFFDASALHRFFEDGQIGLVHHDQQGKHSIEGGTTRLWAGDHPEVSDLLQQLKAPAQVMQARRMYRKVATVLPLSDQLIMTTTFLRRESSTIETLSRSMEVDATMLKAGVESVARRDKDKEA